MTPESIGENFAKFLLIAFGLYTGYSIYKHFKSKKKN